MSHQLIESPALVSWAAGVFIISSTSVECGESGSMRKQAAEICIVSLGRALASDDNNRCEYNRDNAGYYSHNNCTVHVVLLSHSPELVAV